MCHLAEGKGTAGWDDLSNGKLPVHLTVILCN